jgi:dienelactone hydrolase
VAGKNVAEQNDYIREPFEYGGIRHDVYRGGKVGPVVLLLHEMPSFGYRTVKLANHIRDQGFRIVMPILVGGIREEATGAVGKKVALVGDGVDFAVNVAKVCISWEFVGLVQRRTSPITMWLLGLAREEAAKHDVDQVGVIGMCFSGGFALATAIDPIVGVAVVSQPAVPFAWGLLGRIPGQAADLGVSDEDRQRLLDRVGEPGFCVRTLRFQKDKIAPAARVAWIKEHLAPDEVYDSIASERPAHSVLADATDVPKDPSPQTKIEIDKALASVIATLKERLPASPAAPQ